MKRTFFAAFLLFAGLFTFLAAFAYYDDDKSLPALAVFFFWSFASFYMAVDQIRKP